MDWPVSEPVHAKGRHGMRPSHIPRHATVAHPQGHGATQAMIGAEYRDPARGITAPTARRSCPYG